MHSVVSDEFVRDYRLDRDEGKMNYGIPVLLVAIFVPEYFVGGCHCAVSAARPIERKIPPNKIAVLSLFLACSVDARPKRSQLIIFYCHSPECA